MKEWDSFDKIIKAKGVWLIDSKGNKIMDAVASMWCNVWGHSNPQLIKAITEQSKKLQHSSQFNLTTDPAEKLADNLIKVSPKMHKVFYSDNGSSAMEIAIKISLQYWKNMGNKTKRKQRLQHYKMDIMGTHLEPCL
jgi:adenosylmethionine-8-amino-7-oxononanoate aminotransferase